MQRIFTTGQVARVLSVNINTVIKWFDERRLDGFRLPRSNERRIYRESVQRFMREHGISASLLDEFDTEIRAQRGLPASEPEVRSRVFQRFAVDIPGTIHFAGLPDGAVASGIRVRNVSMGGALLSHVALPSGWMPEAFDLHIDADTAAFVGVCELIHLARDSDDGYVVGARFTRVDPSTLHACLESLGVDPRDMYGGEVARHVGAHAP